MTKIGRVTLRYTIGRKEPDLIRLKLKLCNKHTDCRDNGDYVSVVMASLPMENDQVIHY